MSVDLEHPKLGWLREGLRGALATGNRGDDHRLFQEAFLSTGVGLGSIGLRQEGSCSPASIVHAFYCAMAFPNMHLWAVTGKSSFAKTKEKEVKREVKIMGVRET